MTTLAELKENVELIQKEIAELEGQKHHPDNVVVEIKKIGEGMSMPEISSKIEGDTAYITIRLKRTGDHFYPSWDIWDPLHEHGYKLFNVYVLNDKTIVIYSLDNFGGSD